tara:strand:- start:1119 stop:1517 length:399 start_codon:yes stop_codon:yes gene_type:complete
MIQIYYKYTEWEDFQNGMFETKFKNEDELILKAAKLLSNEIEFYNTSLKVLDNWKISSDVNLSNKNSNRQSWIGQAACCYAFGVPEILTRKAWNGLDNTIKIKANLIADKIIKVYERKYFEIHTIVGKEMLF